MEIAIKRGIIVFLGLIIQILLSLLVYLFFIDKIGIINGFYTFLGFILILGLIKDSKNYSYTLPWIIILMIFPLIGTLMYIILGKSKNNSKTLKSIVKSEEENKKYLVQDQEIRNEFKENTRTYFISSELL